MIDPKLLFEELNKRVDKPIEYNHLITQVFAELTSGNISYDNGIPFLLDPTRQKELSLSRPVITSAFYGLNQSNRYLRLDGVTASGNGFLMPRKATITALWAKSRSEGGWAIEIRRNDSPIALSNATITDGWGKIDNLSIDLDEGDYIQLYLNGDGVDHPIACFEFAWRKN